MRRMAGALVRSAHAGPSLTVALVTVLLAIGLAFEPWRIALVGIAMLIGQFAVGWSNDAIDAERDRATGRTDKPIVSGAVSARVVSAFSWTSIVVALALTTPLGLLATAAHAVFILSGLAYNLWLKGSLLSVVPYMVGFGVLPLYVTLSSAPPLWAAPWTLVAGASLGIAAHLANAIPDLEDDSHVGVRGLPQRLGYRASGLATYLVLAVASVVVVAAPQGAVPISAWIGLALNLSIVVTGVSLVIARPPTRLHFQLILGAAVITVAMLALSGKRLLS